MPNRINILIVEDNQGDLIFLQEMLKDSGLQIKNLHITVNLKSAVIEIHQNKPDIILLDLFLPDSNEKETFNLIKENAPGVPIIVLSGLTDKKMALETVQNGAQDFLIKGEYDGKLLGKVINYGIERQKSVLQLQQSEANFRALLNATNDTYLMLDKNLNLLAFNRIDYKSDKKTAATALKGLHVLEVVDIDDHDLFREYCAASLKGITSSFEIYYPLNGTLRYAQFSFNPIYSTNLSANGICVCIQDITERKKIQRDLIKAIIDAQEMEKTRFSRELHDGLIQVLVAVKMNLNAIEKTKFDLDEEDLFSNAVNLLSESINEARAISHDLMPAEFEKNGLRESLDTLKTRIVVGSKMEVSFLIDFEEHRMSKQYLLNLYRIIQEFSTNTLKYAKATKLSIDVRQGDEWLFVEISDNGRGFNVDSILNNSAQNGIGIRNMINRIKLMNGQVKLNSIENKGTTLKIIIPLEPVVVNA